MILRDYQQDGVDRIRAAYRQRRSVLYQLATGGGKTVIFTFIAHGTQSKGNRVWIIVHRRELVDQVSATLDQQGVMHGVVAAGYTMSPLAMVQVCSVQSLARRAASLPEPDLIVVDEAHHSAAGTWARMLASYPSARVLGVTATPLRLDGRGLSDHYQTIICGPPMHALIERGYLARPALYVPPSDLDLSGVKITGGDYNSKQVSARADTPTITGDAVEHYTRICKGKRAIAFCTTIRHAEHVTAAMRSAGYRWSLLVGQPAMSAAQRRNASLALEHGDLDGVSTVDLVSEGYDLPAVEVAILLRPTQSLGLYLQQVGRALRPAPGKDRAIILDCVGNVERHGIPQLDREWTLDGAQKRKAASDSDEAYRQCPACYYFHPTAPVCPECGHVYEATGRAPPPVEDGDLREVRDDEMERARLARDQRKSEERSARTLEDLQELGRRRGYKPGWAKHRWEYRRSKGYA